MSEPITRNGRLVADIERIAELETFVAAYDDYRALFIVPSTSYAFMKLEEARKALEPDE